MAPSAAQTRSPSLVDLDITKPGFYLAPDYYDALRWLREHEPVSHLSGDTWLISTYDHIREISRQPELFTSRRGVIVNDPLRVAEPNDEAGSLVHLDPPLHAEYRKLLNRRFTPRAASFLEPAIRSAVNGILDTLNEGDEIDLVERIAVPIPVTVIAELLGVPNEHRASFRAWSDAIIEVADNPYDEAVLAETTDFFAFLESHVRSRFESPGDDLLSTLTQSEVGGKPLTEAQVQMFCLTLLVAGNETTRALISGGAAILAEHPDQRAALAADEALLAGAVEECLRWVSPIQAFCRTTNEPVVLGDTKVPANQYLVLLYASGNRDEAAFGPTAARFDLRRPVSPAHLAFGFGEHLCLGAALARMEAQIVFEQVLRRFPRYEVLETPTYVPSTLTRSIATMPVRLSA